MIFDRFRIGWRDMRQAVRLDPASLAVASFALTGISAAVGFAGAITQGNAARAAANRQADIDKRNAVLAGQDRIQAIQTAQIAAADKNRENRRQLASMRAAYGSSGLEMAGSPLDVLSDGAAELSLDSRRIGYEGQVKGREGALRMLGLTESADTAIATGINSRNASIVSGFGNLLSSGATAANNYAKAYPSTPKA